MIKSFFVTVAPAGTLLAVSLLAVSGVFDTVAAQHRKRRDREGMQNLSSDLRKIATLATCSRHCAE